MASRRHNAGLDVSRLHAAGVGLDPLARGSRRAGAHPDGSSGFFVSRTGSSVGRHASVFSSRKLPDGSSVVVLDQPVFEGAVEAAKRAIRAKE